MHNTVLRNVVASIDREVAALPPATSTALVASWGELVKLLALGPEPELRKCPTCHKVGMLAATRCGFCWTSLAPIAPVAALAPVAP